MTVTGFSFTKIANTLNMLGIKGRLGNTNWTASGIISLLSNEKYAGELWARKTVTTNYKTHKSKKNNGQKPRYHVKNHHEAIVPTLAYDAAVQIIKCGAPYLKAVQEGALKGFITVNKAVRGYTLEDYTEVSNSVYKEADNSEISIFADKASIFDLRSYDTVSTLLFDEHTKPSCLIKDGKVTFNSACRKSLGTEKAELLFHPAKAIIAIRSSVDEPDFQNLLISKPVHLTSFVPVALESAELQSGYRYRIYGTKRAKNGESIMFFDLRNAQIISKEKDGYILPDKYANRYGDGYYENLTACDLHKIDIDGLWQALQESRPADSLSEDIVELTKFCQNNLSEFGLLEKLNK
jgi:hypothetical protein